MADLEQTGKLDPLEERQLWPERFASERVDEIINAEYELGTEGNPIEKPQNVEQCYVYLSKLLSQKDSEIRLNQKEQEFFAKYLRSILKIDTRDLDNLRNYIETAQKIREQFLPEDWDYVLESALASFLQELFRKLWKEDVTKLAKADLECLLLVLDLYVEQKAENLKYGIFSDSLQDENLEREKHKQVNLSKSLEDWPGLRKVEVANLTEIFGDSLQGRYMKHNYQGKNFIIAFGKGEAVLIEDHDSKFYSQKRYGDFVTSLSEKSGKTLHIKGQKSLEQILQREGYQDDAFVHFLRGISRQLVSQKVGEKEAVTKFDDILQNLIQKGFPEIKKTNLELQHPQK
ncbi:MAG: hypothetical protein PHU71_01990 [Candidatus Gracilibacteria bacterium]|nr:hypothetical protein [Candidatus Gracilibacteria bacterium]